MAVDLGRPWMCPSGHLLGHVRRENGVRRLFLQQGHVATGMVEVACPECGARKTWHSGQDGIEQLLRYNRARAGDGEEA